MTKPLSITFSTACLASVVALSWVGCGNSETPNPPQAASTPPNASVPINPGGGAPLPPELQAIMQQGQEIQSKLEVLGGKLNTIQQEAMQADHIVTIREALETTAEEAILKEDPTASDMIKRLPELVKELEANPEIVAGNPAAFSEATQKLIEEYETLTGRLQPLQTKAAELPEISEARTELFDAIHAQAITLDPEFESMEKEFDSLSQQLNELEQSFMSTQQAMAPPSGLPNVSTPIPGPPPASAAAMAPVEAIPAEAPATE